MIARNAPDPASLWWMKHKPQGGTNCFLLTHDCKNLTLRSLWTVNKYRMRSPCQEFS